MTNLNLLKYFITVAELKNITKAAEKLYISQPALTKAIKQLEEEMGGKLLDRRNKGVALTTEGKYIFRKVKPLIERIDNLYDYFGSVEKLEKGVLRIATITSNITLILNDYLGKFISMFPNISVNIKRGQENTLSYELRENEVDFVFMDSEFVKADMQVVKKFAVKYAVVGDKSYYDKYVLNPMTISDFTQEPLALISKGKTSRQNIDDFFQNKGYNLSAKYEMENYDLLVEMIKKGVAIGVVNPDYFIDEIQNGKLYVLPTDFEINKRIICLAKSKINHNNPAREQFEQIFE